MIGHVRGTIARRLLINFRVDPEVAQRQLPHGFEPKIAHGYAIAGVCLIRLERERPAVLPSAIGLSSENAAHRFGAFHVSADGTRRECVYIARRHTGSRFNAAIGGRLFPGEHRLARFAVTESNGRIDLAMSGSDGLDVRVRACPARGLPPTSIFLSSEDASAYFQPGTVGYSERRQGTTLDGLRLATVRWAVEPLAIDDVAATFFDDRSRFPEGSIAFDHGLVMSHIAHEWYRVPPVLLSASRAPDRSLRPS